MMMMKMKMTMKKDSSHSLYTPQQRRCIVKTVEQGCKPKDSSLPGQESIEPLPPRRDDPASFAPRIHFLPSLSPLV